MEAGYCRTHCNLNLLNYVHNCCGLWPLEVVFWYRISTKSKQGPVVYILVDDRYIAHTENSIDTLYEKLTGHRMAPVAVLVIRRRHI